MSKSVSKEDLLKIVKPTRDAAGNHEIPDVIQRSDFSEDSLDVLENFGLEAPTLLNQYACAVEDQLIALVDTIKGLRAERQIIADAYAALRDEFNEYKAAATTERSNG